MKFLIISTLLLANCFCFSQVKIETLIFNKTKHDFGLIPELGGPVSCRFIITNTGEKPLIIYNAKPSCSCTVSEWDKSPILSGDSTEIETSYAPKGRPGVFNKSITLHTNARPTPITLSILGTVEPRPQTLNEKYPIAVKQLRLSSSNINFNELDSKKTYQQKINFINTSNQKVDIRFLNEHKHIKTSCTPSSLAPQETGTITIDYDAHEKNDWGWCYDITHYTVNGISNSSYTIKIRAKILDKTEWNNEQRKNAPIISIDNKTYLFDEVTSNEKVECPFLITNQGKSDLIIHKIKHSCSCTSSDKSSLSIKPGQSMTLPIVFDTKNIFGLQRKTIILYTNTIENVVKISVQGNVTKNKK